MYNAVVSLWGIFPGLTAVHDVLVALSWWVHMDFGIGVFFLAGGGDSGVQ